MTPTVITPSGPGAIEAGLVLDEEGQRFVVLTFRNRRASPYWSRLRFPSSRTMSSTLSVRPRQPTGAFQADHDRLIFYDGFLRLGR